MLLYINLLVFVFLLSFAASACVPLERFAEVSCRKSISRMDSMENGLCCMVFLCCVLA